MEIFADADACPVVRIVEDTARSMGLPCTLLADTNHVLKASWARVITVEAGRDAVDFQLAARIRPGDVFITGDYGAAALALGKGAFGLHPDGRRYTREKIDLLLMERHLNAKARRGKGKKHVRGPAPRSREDDLRFKASLLSLLRETGGHFQEPVSKKDLT